MDLCKGCLSSNDPHYCTMQILCAKVSSTLYQLCPCRECILKMICVNPCDKYNVMQETVKIRIQFYKSKSEAV